MSIELFENSLVVEHFSKVSVFKYFQTKGSRGGLESEVNVGKLSFYVSNCVAINSYNQFHLSKLRIVT